MARRVAMGLTASLVVFAGLVVVASTARASCAGPPDIEQSLDSSDLVFVGSVTDLANADRWATFRVETTWKGDPGGDAVEVRSGPAGVAVATSNDRTYTSGERYLVFATDLSRRPGAGIHFGDGVRWVDDACSATQLYESSLDRFRPARPGTEDPPSGGLATWPLTIVVVVILAGAAAVVRRRRNAIG